MLRRDLEGLYVFVEVVGGDLLGAAALLADLVSRRVGRHAGVARPLPFGFVVAGSGRVRCELVVAAVQTVNVFADERLRTPAHGALDR